ncbi:PAS-domain containing protein [Roseibium sp. HPY-6]|uniref:PAS-domain containing protein n=1 Tax=Roseibium sp. HPY-6 TaxID=3229852 RepID=UPI00338F6EF3
MSVADRTADSEARDRTVWIEDAFDALDVAAIVFDAEGRCVASNQRYDRLFLPAGAPPRVGETIGALTRRIGETRQIVLFPGLPIEEAAVASEEAVRSFVRDMEVPLADGRILIGASHPTRSGGYLVTFRDGTPDKIGEHHAMELLDGAFESAEMGMILWDASLRVQRVNSAWCRLIANATPGDSVRDHWLASTPVEYLLSSQHSIQVDKFIAEAHRSTTQRELTFGQGRRIQIATFPTRSNGVLATAIDVTEARSAEARARELLEDAIEALGEGVALFDKDMRLNLKNRSFDSLVYGDLDPGATGSSFFTEIERLLAANRIIPHASETSEDAARRITRAVHDRKADLKIGLPAGQQLEVSTFSTALGGILVSVRDVTEKMRAEQAQREADEMVRTIVDANPTAFLMCRMEDGEIIYISPLTRERFGDARTTRNFFYDPADRIPYLEALSVAGSLDDYPVRLRAVDGSLVQGLMSVRVVDYRGDKVLVSSVRDITDQLAMQAELERQREVAHQNEKLSALGELLAGVAHELNNPLSVVLGYSMMLKDQVLDAANTRRVEEIATAAERCARIVKTFLAMARQRPTEIALVSVNEMVELASEVSGYGLRSSGGQIDITLDPADPHVAADADQIVQVFCNLMVNAEQALKDNPNDARLSITVGSAPESNDVSIAFEDNGPGIKSALRSRIFEPYFTTKDIGEGTGIGLAFCHRIITSHGGRISVDAAPYGGARFLITLPKTATANNLKPLAPRVSRFGPVLVLDDDPGIRQMLTSLLEETGYDVTMTERADEALEICAQKSFVAILSDMTMPEMSGDAFLAALRDISPQNAERVAFLTGDTLSEKAVARLGRANRPYLEKPASQEDVLAIIDQLASATPEE